MFDRISAIPKDVDIQKQLTEMHIKEWVQNDAFRVRWWILIAAIAVIWIIWWIALDKSRFMEISLFVVLSTILFMGVHEYGEELTLWEYPTDIIPVFPPLSSINLACYPMIYSLVYQHFSQKRNFLFADLIVSAVICFIFEPLLSWAKFYYLLHWNYIFNFLIYTIIALFVKIVVVRICARSRSKQN